MTTASLPFGAGGSRAAMTRPIVRATRAPDWRRVRRASTLRASAGLGGGPARFDRRVGAAAPLDPRAVIEREIPMAEQMEAKQEDRRRDPGAAACHHRLPHIEAGFTKEARE